VVEENSLIAWYVGWIGWIIIKCWYTRLATGTSLGQKQPQQYCQRTVFLFQPKQQLTLMRSISSALAMMPNKTGNTCIARTGQGRQSWVDARLCPHLAGF
jgi:hypothetical protein